MKVTNGSLWLGKDWKEAIQLSFNTPDCGVEPVYETRHDQQNSLLGECKKVLIG